MYNPEIGFNNQDENQDNEEIVGEIMTFFGPGKLPAEHPKWKSIINNIEDEEYSKEELTDILAELKNAMKKLQKVQENFFEGSFDESLSKKDIEIAKNEIKSIVESIKNGDFENIGSGNSATVFLDEEHPGYCFKILKSTAIDNPGVNTVEEEGRFLDKVADLSVNGVRAPRPYYYHIDKKKNLCILVMETLDAIDVKDILKGDVLVPDDFDFEKSYQDLKEYFIQLNEEKGISHNDVFVRNLMIDLNNLCFRVVDFGKSQIREQNHDGISSDLANIVKLKKNLESIFKIP